MKRKHLLLPVAVLSVLALSLAACSSDGGETPTQTQSSDSSAPASSDTSQASSEEPAGGDVTEVTILSNWFAQPEVGGYFQADAENLAGPDNVKITMKQGGPGIQTVPQVAAGEAQFGISHTDEIMVAIAAGLPLVAVSSAFAKDIQCLAYHKDTGIKDFPDLAGHKVSRVPSPYWDYIVAHYKLEGKVDPINIGSLANFQNDHDIVQQCFITSEPYTIKEMGMDDVGYLKISDSGYTPYRNLLFTTKEYADKNPDVVKAVAKAVSTGWEHYLADPTKGNELIMKTNPDGDPKVIEFANQIFKENPDLFTSPIGSFDDAQWKANRDQLVEAGLLKADFDYTQAYLHDN